MMFLGIAITDWIQAIMAIVSLVVSLIALYQSKKSIEQANKSLALTEQSIRDANKSVMIAYFDTVNVTHVDKYLIIKNFGSTPATILDIKTTEMDVKLDLQQRIKSINNTMFAPNQKFVTQLIKMDNTENDDLLPFDIELTYKDTLGEIYIDNFSINPKITKAMFRLAVNNTKYSEEHNSFRNVIQNLIKEFKF